MSEIGNFLLLATMFLSSLSIIVLLQCRCERLKGAWQSIKSSNKLYYTGLLRQLLHNFLAMMKTIAVDIIITHPFYLSVLSTLLTFCTLIYAFIISDFSLQNVFLNSSSIKPLIYKIAGSWSSHEGSILLWFCLLQIISSCYIFLIKNPIDKILPIIILSILQLLFSSFIYFTSNPFNVFSFNPSEGLGLNPMLQDIALSIHPPLLYLGYISYVVPFTCSCVILVTYNFSLENLRLIKIFANIGILFTTIGIALGSWWAYRELGWGGFWFFDPVENISLFPWLSAIALHHSIIVTKKTGRMQSWTLILSIITFLLVIFSTFLVRSGFITSIHSFAFSSERGVYLLTIFLIVSIASIGLYIMRTMSFPLKQKSNSSVILGSRFCGNDIVEKGIIFGNIFFLLSLVILICATLYPLIYPLFDDKIIIIGEEFFINNFIIFVIPILFVVGFFTTNRSIKNHIIILTFSLIITYLISFKVTFGVISVLTVIPSIFLMIHNIYYFLVKTNYFKQTLKTDIATMILGHFGFALIAFSITINARLQSEIDFTGEVGTSKIFREFKVTLQNIKFTQGKNYYRQIAEFWLEDQGHNITILKPENRLYTIEKTLSQESDIYSYLLYDLYAVLSNIDGDTIHAKIYYRPMMSFIWLGVIITAGGFFIGLINKRK